MQIWKFDKNLRNPNHLQLGVPVGTGQTNRKFPGHFPQSSSDTKIINIRPLSDLCVFPKNGQVGEGRMLNYFGIRWVLTKVVMKFSVPVPRPDVHTKFWPIRLPSILVKRCRGPRILSDRKSLPKIDGSRIIHSLLCTLGRGTQT